jgi:hypothetical protein
MQGRGAFRLLGDQAAEGRNLIEGSQQRFAREVFRFLAADDAQGKIGVEAAPVLVPERREVRLVACFGAQHVRQVRVGRATTNGTILPGCFRRNDRWGCHFGSSPFLPALLTTGFRRTETRL